MFLFLILVEVFNVSQLFMRRYL